jgi:hypothetical protein
MDTEIGSHYHHYVYLSTHDPDVNCAKLARCLLDDLGFKLTIKVL